MTRSLPWAAILLLALLGPLHAADDTATENSAADNTRDLLIERILAVVDEDVVMLS